MLHCNMTMTLNSQLALDDLLADLQHARRTGDLGRLALIAYCDLRRWARQVGETSLSAQAGSLLTDVPHPTREAFLARVDDLIQQTIRIQASLSTPQAAA